MLRVIHAVKAGGDLLGVEVALGELAVAQHHIGLDVHLLVNGEWPEGKVRAHGIPVHQVASRDLVRSVRTLATPDTVVHSHTLWSTITMLPLLLGASRPAMALSPHGSLAAEALRSKRLKKRLAWATLLRRAVRMHEGLVVTSPAERCDVEHLLPGQRIELLPNAIVAPPGLGDVLPSKSQTVGYVGRLHPIKGTLELIEAWRRVSALAHGWRLRIVGPVEDAAYYGRLRALADPDPTISLEGPLYGPDKWRMLAECELVVVPSRSENFGNVVAEAFLMGTPVVATLGVPWPEIEEEGIGWRGPGDADGLAAMLRSAMSASSVDRAERGSRGRALVDARYNHELIARRSIGIYERLRDYSKAIRRTDSSGVDQADAS